jgi:hypothetical protein
MVAVLPSKVISTSAYPPVRLPWNLSGRLISNWPELANWIFSTWGVSDYLGSQKNLAAWFDTDIEAIIALRISLASSA